MAAATLAALVLAAPFASAGGALAQKQAPEAGAVPPAPDAGPAKPAKPRAKTPKPTQTRAAGPARNAAPAPQPASPPPVAAVAPAPAGPAPEIAGQLRRNGAGACGAQIDALAAASMGEVAQFNTVSSWATTGGNGRVASVSIAQKYPDGSAVPFGATSVIAAPNGQGSCDALSVQVVPSPLPCARLRDTIAARGRQIGDLAGVPLMQDGGAQTLLVPTAANTCVLVGLRTAYAQ